MHSCLYQGSVWHRRLSPIEHNFRYSISLLYLDLAEVEEVFAGRIFWSTRRWCWARFRREDHLGAAHEPLAKSVRDEIERQGHEPSAGPIRLLTQPRYLGFVMNPVSFYFCFDQGENLQYLLAEVNNTPWGERHCYVIPQDFANPQAKEFHVSPFMPMDMEYHWQVSAPAQQLQIGIKNWRQQQVVFQASLQLERLPITTRNLAWSLVRFPLMTYQIFTAIYWQAFLLWRKGCPYHPHPKEMKPTPSSVRAPHP